VKAIPVVAVVALLALGGACGDDQDPTVGPGAGATTTSASGAATSSTTSSTTSGAGGGFATTTVSVPRGERGLLAKVTATHAGDVDRVTFTFEDAVPGYRIGYVDRPIVEDGSGAEVAVDGASVLEAHFEPASGFDLAGDGRQVYTGPTRLDLATTVVLDVVRTGDFEAVLAWAIGVDVADAPFRVRTTAHDVIVEVRAPAG
jgi:hypothetical protein